MRKLMLLVCVVLSAGLLVACGENPTPSAVSVTNRPVQPPAATPDALVTPLPFGSPATTRTTAATLPGGGIKLPDNPAFKDTLVDAAIEVEFGRLAGIKDAAIRLYTANDGNPRALYSTAYTHLALNGYSQTPGQTYPLKRAGMEVGLFQKAGAPDVLVAAFANDELPPLNENAIRNPIPALNLDLSRRILDSAKTGKYGLVLVSGEGLASKATASLNE